MNFNKNITVTAKTLTNEIIYKDKVILSYKIDYPQFTSKQYLTVCRKLNALYENGAKSYERYISTKMLSAAILDYNDSVKNGYPYHGYEINVNFVITYNNNCVISLYTDKYEYTGGAHGNTVRVSQTWNINNGRQIALKELFPQNTHHVIEIISDVNYQIGEQIKAGSNYYFEDYINLVDKAFKINNFYLTHNALVVYFQQYEIAPYSSGILTYEIPYNSVDIVIPTCEM